MSEGPRQLLFLARQTYRRRRLMDAARLLPLFGAFLFLLPVLWGPGSGRESGAEAGRVTAGDGIYLMLAWAGLIVVAFLMARALAPQTDEAAPPLPEGGPGNRTTAGFAPEAGDPRENGDTRE